QDRVAGNRGVVARFGQHVDGRAAERGGAGGIHAVGLARGVDLDLERRGGGEGQVAVDGQLADRVAGRQRAAVDRGRADRAAAAERAARLNHERGVREVAVDRQRTALDFAGAGEVRPIAVELEVAL